jgi:putative peptidoglycan lipid II flippase
LNIEHERQERVLGASFRKKAISATFWGNFALVAAYAAQLTFISRFGVGRSLDVYLATNSIANFFLAGVGGGFLNSLVSGLLRDRDNGSGFTGVASATSIIIGMIFIVIGTMLGLFALPVLHSIMPGLMVRCSELAINLLKVNALAFVLNGVAFGLTGILYAQGKMGLASFSPAFVSLGGMIGALLFGGSYGVSSIAWGTAAGSLVRLVASFALLYRVKSIKVPRERVEWAKAKEVLRMSFPLSLIGMLFFASSLMDKRFASYLPSGSITLLNYGILLNTTVVSLMSGGLAIAGTQSLSSNEKRRSQVLFWKMVWSSLLVMPPIIAIYLIAREPIITLVFGWGKVNAKDIVLLGKIILWSSGILIAAPTAAVISALYAERKIREVAVSILTGLVLFWLVATELVSSLGITGLALAYSAFYITSAVVLMIFLFRSGFIAEEQSLFTQFGGFVFTLFIGAAGGVSLLHASKYFFQNASSHVTAAIQILLVSVAIFATQVPFWRRAWLNISGFEGKEIRE